MGTMVIGSLISQLIWLIWLNIRREIWRWFLKLFKTNLFYTRWKPQRIYDFLCFQWVYNGNIDLKWINVKSEIHSAGTYPANIYLFKVNSRNIRKRCENCVMDVVIMSLLLTLSIFHTFIWCFYCWF